MVGLAIGVGLRHAAVGDSAKGHVTAHQTLLRRRLRQRHLVGLGRGLPRLEREEQLAAVVGQVRAARALASLDAAQRQRVEAEGFPRGLLLDSWVTWV